MAPGRPHCSRFLAGFIEPDSGQVLLNGKEIVGLSPQRRNFGVVFQHFALFPHMSAFDNVAFPLRARHHGSERYASVSTGP